MSKVKIIRAICERKSGSIQNVRMENKVVVADFIGEVKKEPKTVPFTNLRFPHHKAKTAAEELKIGVLKASEEADTKLQLA
jgi:hypothetical protein